MKPVLFTVGHSTRTLDELAELLGGFAVERLLDVRTIRRSRRNPQFNEDAIMEPLAAHSISYEAMPGLGGRRPRSRSDDDSANGGWKVQSFRNFADYALTAPFAVAFHQLREVAGQQRCAVMCAEAVWWRCHRRIICDWFLAAGGEVMHIMGAGRADRGSLTPFARVQDDRSVLYPG
jgi:uncharacterized protein (DUF488 family)